MSTTTMGRKDTAILEPRTSRFLYRPSCARFLATKICSTGARYLQAVIDEPTKSLRTTG